MSLEARTSSPEFTAVRHILTSPSIAARCAAHVGEEEFDWAGLNAAAETMSGGERVLVRIAQDLWEATGLVPVSELPRRLDGRNLSRVLDALVLYRSGASGGEERLRDAA